MNEHVSLIIRLFTANVATPHDKSAPPLSHPVVDIYHLRQAHIMTATLELILSALIGVPSQRVREAHTRNH